MKCLVYSDLHLDHYSSAASTKFEKAFWYPPELPDDKDTVLLLAGDIWIGTKFIEWAGFSWIEIVAKRFKQVLIVLGNHSYWGNGDLTIKDGGDKCNAMLQDRGLDNVKVLDMDTWSEGEYVVLGCTLWTDMNKCDGLAMYNMPRYMRYDGKIRYSTGPAKGQYEHFTSDRWVQTHDRHKTWLKKTLEENKDKKCIVMTHHAPLNTLIDPMYIGDDSNAYYTSDLSDLILDNTQIKLWCFGHVHYQQDTWLVDTRLINNCVGYPGEHHEQRGNVKHEVVEVL